MYILLRYAVLEKERYSVYVHELVEWILTLDMKFYNFYRDRVVMCLKEFISFLIS